MLLYSNRGYEKITQILNFFATKADGSINRMKALKLMFLTDRYHLRKYGRLTSYDDYVAMELGPVPSMAMDIAEGDDCLSDKLSDYVAEYISPVNQYAYRSIKPVDEDVFSETDMEAMNFAWEQFGNLNQWDLSELTHAYPEFKKHEQEIESGIRAVDMSLMDFFDDPDTAVNKCYELSDEDKKLRREMLSEAEHIASLWR